MTTPETAQTSTPTTTPEPPTGNADNGLSQAMASLMQAKGLAPIPSEAPPAQRESGAPNSDANPVQGKLVEGAAADPNATPVPAAEQEAKKPPQPLTQAQLLDRVAAKDALYQQERNARRTLEQQVADLKKQQDDFFARFSADPIAVMAERGVRFGDLAMKALAGDKGQQPPTAKPGESTAQLSPELVALQKQLQEQADYIKQIRERDQQAELQRQNEESLNVLREFLPTEQFPLVNELGKHEEVRRRVQLHMGQHGGFADDREAEEVLHYYAREIESEEKQRLLGTVGKPGIRTLLSKELGLPAASSTQREAPPARQENEGIRTASNPRPVLSNDLSTQRTVVSTPQSWDKDEAMRRTIAEMSALRGAH